MARNLFILGAGASACAGIPLMNGFIEHSEDLGDQNIALRKKFHAALEFRQELRSAQSRTKIDLNNIESVFGALEMASLVNSLGSKSTSEIEEIRKSFISLIAETVQYSATLSMNENSGFPEPPPPYTEFTRMLTSSKNEYAIITFNYDILLDYTFEYHSQNIYYGIEKDDAKSDDVKMYKLHGSVNWSLRENEIIAYHLYQSFASVYDLKIYQKKKGKIIISELSPFEQPMIIPPSWNKAQYHGQLSRVWHKAATEFHNVRNLIIIGFSLPETDSFFKFLLSIGTIDNRSLRRIVVINPDTSVKDKFRSLLGQDSEHRFEMIVKKFEDCLGDLSSIVIK